MSGGESVAVSCVGAFGDWTSPYGNNKLAVETGCVSDVGAGWTAADLSAETEWAVSVVVECGA